MSPLRPRYMRVPSDPHELSGVPEKNADMRHSGDHPVGDTPAEEVPEESSRIVEGTYRQIRDYSLVLLSQGIVHRLDRSPEGPFEILVKPEHEPQAIHQLELYRKENPPREENPPLPLSLSLQPVWVLLVPVVCTLLDFSGKVARMHSLGLSDADKVMHGQWWRTITALTLHGDARHIASNLLSGYIVLTLLSYRTPLARMAPFLAVASALELLHRPHRADGLPFPRVLHVRVRRHRGTCRNRVQAHAQGDSRPAPSLRTAVRRRLARRIPRAWRKRRHSRPRLRVYRGALLRVHPQKEGAPLGNAYQPGRPRVGRYLFRDFRYRLEVRTRLARESVKF